MATETPIVGTIGLKISVAVGLDVSGAQTKELKYMKPDGTTGTFSGLYEFAGGDHRVYYVTTSANDIDQEGRWTFQAYVESGINRFHGTQVKTEKFVTQLF